jgi:low affinity Fe/Cu permease
MEDTNKSSTIVLGEKTKITISLSLLITFLGGVVWLTDLAAKTQQNEQNLKELKGYMYYKIQRIEDKLDYIIERLPRQ